LRFQVENLRPERGDRQDRSARVKCSEGLIKTVIFSLPS
jgi:hypothetical protein